MDDLKAEREDFIEMPCWLSRVYLVAMLDWDEKTYQKLGLLVPKEYLSLDQLSQLV